MKKQEYAIVDIETTGGNASHSRITEIAIIIHDGEKVIDRWETLVNPEKEIPPAIFALTGITNEMVSNAPLFDAISDKVFELLTERVFVAHNVNFDYSFIRHELERAGLKWTAKKLCTVRAARKIRPGMLSYSLGRLCKSLDIDLENRHRAGGDADATVILFSRLLEWDTNKEMDKMIKKTAQDQRLPPNLPREDYDKLPDRPGVYYFYNEYKKVIYVGKAINLKKRVASHFGGHKITPQRQHFLRDICAITFEVCGTELMALLLECTEIKQLWPVYNKALKRFEPKYGLFEYEARNNYRYLAIGKLTKNQKSIETFNTLYEGINLLQELSKQFELDHRFCKYGCISSGETLFQTDTTDLPAIENHNNQIQAAIDFYLNRRPSFAIIDKGRNEEERSCIWVENGHFYGMGYVDSYLAFNDPSHVKDYITPYKTNQYIMQLISSYVQKYPGKVHLHQNELEVINLV
jgi:DNA polymerase-3 subunit epsilon